MELKTKKPITPAQRHLIQLNTKHLRNKPSIKKKLKGLKNFAGRNNSGKITVHHKGGGHKKKYRYLNFYRINDSIGITIGLEYDPNRNSSIASIYDIIIKDFYYILAPKNLKIGDIVKSGSNAEPKIGHSLAISEIPIGSYIHNISPTILKSAKISRSAGTFSIIKEKTMEYAKIELSSGEQKFISTKCYATMGIVSNELVILTQKGKAGRSRWFNKRPTVRGVAMNPIDHPHGGGEGKKSGKGKTPWGKFVKQGKTNKFVKKLTIKKNKNE